MTGNVITLPAAVLLALATGLPRNYCRALCAVGFQGLAKGYSWSNVVWLMKQVRLETGRGSSSGIQEDNNAWGMSCVRVRPTTQVGCRTLPDGNTLGKYRTVESSVEDRFMWDEYTEGPHRLRKSEAYPGEVNSQGYHPSGIYAFSVSEVDGTDARNVCLALASVPIAGVFLGWLMKTK